MYCVNENDIKIEKSYNSSNCWNVKYPGWLDIHASIYETKLEGNWKYQVVVEYNVEWLREKHFATYDEAVKWVKSTAGHFLNVAKEIHDRTFSLECELAERYKNCESLGGLYEY